MYFNEARNNKTFLRKHDASLQQVSRINGIIFLVRFIGMIKDILFIVICFEVP